MGESENIRNHAAFVWSVADLLRGDYKQSEYAKVVLPLTVIRRLDCVLEPSKQAVLEKHKQLAGRIEKGRVDLRAAALSVAESGAGVMYARGVHVHR